MANEAFRPRKISESDLAPKQEVPSGEDFKQVMAAQQAAGNDMDDLSPEGPVQQEGQPKFGGNIPPEALRMMRQAMGEEHEVTSTRGPKARAAEKAPIARSATFENDVVKELLTNIKELTESYDEIVLPSKGKFYNGDDGPADGVLHLRPMTGAEEKILATPRFVKKGTAVNMIFKNCLKEKFDPDNLLSIDRTYLLIYLRGISYSPEYEVQIKCPECSTNFNTTVDLDSMYTDYCPDDFDDQSLTGQLPVTKFKFTYRLSKGRDETLISEHRERRLRMWGDNAHDDTLHYRASLLVEQIESPSGQVLTGQQNIQAILEKLPIGDVSYIRNLLTDPPFGVDTKVNLICPSCTAEFNTELPLEANFFFPRTRKEKASQA